jgi:hypothetical protein
MENAAISDYLKNACDTKVVLPKRSTFSHSPVSSLVAFADMLFIFMPSPKSLPLSSALPHLTFAVIFLTCLEND